MADSKGNFTSNLSQPNWQEIEQLLDTGLKGQLDDYVEDLARIAETALRQQEDLSSDLTLFKKLVEFAPTILWIANAEGKVEYVNSCWFEFTGSSLEESRGYRWLNYADERDRTKIAETLQQSIKRGVRFEAEYRLIRGSDGASRWCSIKATPIRDENGTLVRWFGCTADIHEQKLFKEELARRIGELSSINAEAENAKHKLIQSEMVFRTMCEASPQILWTADASGHVNYFNPLFYQYTGCEPNSCLGADWLLLTPPENRDFVMRVWQDSIEEGVHYENEVMLRRADGVFRRHVVKAIPLRDEVGTIMRWFGTATDIETLSRLVEELEQARDKAESALAVKSEFVANVSHELRTPMNGILGMVEVLLRSQELTPKVREYVSTIKEASDALLGIINDLLDFSKVEAGKMEIVNSEFDLISLVEGVGDILVPQSASKEIMLLTSIDPALPRKVMGDPLRLRQILLNLAGNAVKFTDDGIVFIKTELLEQDKKDLRVRFSITDSGIGIAPDLRPNMFEPFVQANSSFNRSSSGTGLGLCISMRLAELMHGNLSFESVEGEGSTFTLELPLAAVQSKTSHKVGRPKNPPVVYILEPSSRCGFVIEEKLKILNLKAKAFPNCDLLLKALENDHSAPAETGKVVLLDEVRDASEAALFYQSIKNKKIGQSLPILHLTGATPENLADFDALDFQLQMPLRSDELMEYLWHLEQSSSPVIKDNKKGSPQASRTRLPSMAPDQIAEAEKIHPATKRVLVADDNKINLQVADLLLSDLGLAVDTVDDGIEAVSVFKDAPYDLVVLDCQMPILDGFESCRIIKEIQSRKGRRVPVIAMTAHAIAGSKENCLARGFDDYLSKPIVPKELERIVKFWLGMNESRTPAQQHRSPTPNPDREENHVLSQLLIEKNEFSDNVGSINLALLRSRFNDKNVKSLLGMFISSFESEIDEFSLAASESDWARLKARTHAFKGACSTICATSAAKLLAELELLALSGDDQAKMQKLESLALELHNVAAEARNFNESHPEV